MNARKIKLFYHPVLKGAREPTQEEIQRKVTIYLTRHPELKHQKTENWSYFLNITWFPPCLCGVLSNCITQSAKETRRLGGYNLLFRQGIT